MSNEAIKTCVVPHFTIEIDAEDGTPPKIWTLVYDYRAIAAAEESLGRDIKKVESWKDISSGKDFPKLIHAGLLRRNPEVTLDDVLDILNPDAQRLLSDRIFDLMFPGLVDAYKATLEAQTGTGATADPNAQTGTTTA